MGAVGEDDMKPKRFRFKSDMNANKSQRGHGRAWLLTIIDRLTFSFHSWDLIMRARSLGDLFNAYRLRPSIFLETR